MKQRTKRRVMGAGALSLVLVSCSAERPAPRAPSHSATPVLISEPESAERDGVEETDLPAADDQTNRSRCEVSMQKWASELGALNEVDPVRLACTEPCVPRIRGRYVVDVGSSYAGALQDAQRSSLERGVEIVEWTPLEDNHMRFVVECDAD